MTDQLTSRQWIGGEWTEADSTRRKTIDPATGNEIGTYFDGGAEVCRSAITAALNAFESTTWRDDAMLRATALNHLADAYDMNLPKVASVLSRENGKLAGEAGFEAHFIPRALRFAAALALTTFGKVGDTMPGRQSLSFRQPIGVAGIIAPWNSPAYLSIRAIAPALAAGCAVVLKLPAQAAQSGQVLADVFSSVKEIPAGIVNVFVESGSDGAKLLVDSPDVPVVSYTGSTAVGRLIAEGAAKNLKRVGLELGGKTPHLIFDDADLAVAVPTIIASSTVFGGQFCMTGSRIIAQSGIAAELREALKEGLSNVRPGPASDPESQMGPLIDKDAVARVDKAVQEAIDAGAEVVVRGGPVTEGPLKAGAFYLPTLLEVTDSSLDIVQTETFGPVQTFRTFETEAEGIRLANETEYGLSACVWTSDVNRPLRVSRRLNSGLISINSWANLAVEFEEGGYKASGLGRLGGHQSIEEFLEHKQIAHQYIEQPHH
ncbi:aldehyde dehydrogenase family protein [Amycolatopsis sp. H20-H5]|uniref:aldehyde dehydrogenase family protein n=1 Tax=Amycolatopsis sp. H20-H5 TaxID=3046309 RepID=UPI002DB93ECD|nr:aldehyde dehydrogenase family protein [Amycolatopsis sp. H20-H5]MEC3975739.1 aldehyde dehydrogenase family protein [Amycolatopsis sp. H20-H5]